MVLNALPEIGPIGLNRLLRDLGGDPRQVLDAGENRLRQVEGIRPETMAAVANWRAHFDPVAEEKELGRRGAEFIPVGDPAYPGVLRKIHDPPIGLYRLGRYAWDLPAIAIVGTRRATPYGRTVARQLAGEFVQAGFCIVSGLAQGIDTAAHEGALEAGGRTIAVLGTGLDLVYPPENRRLQQHIAEAGAVVSELPMGRSASRQTFPMRNRIVSGLADAVIIVESGAAGGAMITAGLAGEQGKPLFAVPGRIDQPTSAGCHQLLRDGASLLSCAQDVLEELAYLGGRRPLPIPPGPSRGARSPAGDLGEDEARILACLAGGESLTVDGLAGETGWPAGRVSAGLLLLELKRRAARRLDGAYEACP